MPALTVIGGLGGVPDTVGAAGTVTVWPVVVEVLVLIGVVVVVVVGK
jgi:hypothetical protein